MDLLFKDVFQSLLFPKCDSCFDIFIDKDSYQAFQAWENRLEEFVYIKDIPYFSLMVPTIDTTKFGYITELLLENEQPCLITGNTGVGKSFIISNMLIGLKENSNFNPVFMNFSAQTKPKETQLAIEGKLNKKGKSLFGARPNERIVIYIDDINMPALEPFGAQPCIELLRSMLDLGGVYDRAKFFWKHIEDTTMLIAGAPPGGGRNPLTPRFVRQFNILNMPNPSDNTLIKVFGSILKGFLYSYNFSDAARRTYDSAVQATIELYRKISSDLLPIPSKFHYTFNSRDVSKVFQGMLMVKPNSVNTPEAMARLWIHECTRIFQDRLVSNADKQWFEDAIYELTASAFKMGWTHEDLFKTPILFSDILKLEAANIYYEDISDKRRIVVKALEEKQEDYVISTNDKLDLVFFDDALEHILRIARILRQPRGNAMLIGVSGSGKQSLAKLAAYLMRCDPFQIELVRGYNQDSFRADFQKIALKCGIERLPLAFILTDAQIAYESFLEDINNVLNTGEVPNLFSKKEDLEMVMNGVRHIVQKLKRPESPEVLWNTFIEGIRENLHIILCMSPVGEALRVRCRKFPSLVNCCVLDWFSRWPETALREVALKFLDSQGSNLSQFSDQLAQACVEASILVENACEQFHREIRRRVYTTPKSFLDHIRLYTLLMSRKHSELSIQQKKLADGLDKLFKTNETVASLKKEMEELQPLLEEQQVKTEQFLKQLAIDQNEANQKERFVNEEAQMVNQQALEIKVIADEAQMELDKATPALKEAEDALSKISKGDIAEVKGFINPSPVVVLVLEAVCVLLGEKTDWNSAKSVMMSIDFMERLMKFDRNSVADNTLRRLRNLTNKPEFEPVYVGQKSLACKSLCMWCRAIDNYAKIAKEVEPKKKKVTEMQAKLDLKNKELMVKQDELQKVRDRVAKLQKECDETVDRKNRLEEELEKTKRRCIAAEKLTLLLADEGVRWKDQIEHLDITLQEIIGDVFVSACIISYLGAFTGPYRDQVTKRIIEFLRNKEVPCSDQFSLSNTLETPIVIREWILEGLPNDQLSIDNGVISVYNDRWPLMIDPQMQANKWIKQHEAQQLKVVRLSQNSFMKVFQVAISSGYPVLFEEVDEKLEPSIDSIVQKQVVDIEGRRVIRVGDQKVDYHHEFKLYMTTKIANPHFLPEVFIKVTVINFSITFEGLQDQLLVEVMKNERPEIEKQRDEIVVKVATAKKSLKQAQDRILDLLANAQGMILDNIELIQTLEQSKQQSEDITKSLEETQLVEAQINDSRNIYVSVAIRGTVLYFVISDMSGIDPMYQYSLHYFKKLFKFAMEQTKSSELLQERLINLEETITRNIFSDICRGLFESHKKIFSFLICTSIRRRSGVITQNAWNLLLRGANQLETIKQSNPDKIFLKDTSWNFILSSAELIPELNLWPSDVKSNIIYWKDFLTQEDIFSQGFPLQSAFAGNESFNPFLKLLIVKAFAPEKLMSSFSLYVIDQMGQFFDEYSQPPMEEICNASDQFTPVIFILSPGADPTSSLFKLGVQFEVISLGQGQGKKAEVMIEKAQNEGTWVLLQNCHLAKSWMPSLENIVETLEERDPKKNFRLFLTSMPAPYFPVSVLQNGIKLTTEPPRGLKANLRRSYGQVNLDSSTKTFKLTLFSLAFFHGIVQERRKFGPIGFNKPYEFNDSDLDISILTLRMFLSNADEELLPWDAIQYMIGQINYGGRVTDDWDRVCLMSILKKLIGDHLEEKIKLSSSGIYYIPVEGQVSDYLKYIEGLPNSEDPEVFGMHENASIVFNAQESSKMIETILSVQPRVGVSSQVKTTDDIVSELASAFESQLPDLLIKENCNQKHFQVTEQGSIPSLSTVLLQEMEKFNKMIEVLRNSLRLLQKAIKGFVVMSQDLDEMYVSFLNNQLPPNWQKQSYSSLKPLGSWFKDFILRVSQMRLWMEKDWIAAYWMSGLFYPQGFLTGLLQTHARRYKTPIDKLGFKFKLIDVELDRIKEEPKDGLYVWGLYLEGARWDSAHDTLVDQSLGQLYNPLPILHFQPIENYTPPDDYYNCPCYKTSNRVGVLSTTGQSTNFILAIDLPSKYEKPEFWTLRGTAIISQLND